MPTLSDIVKINTRFCRSINLNQDLGDADILSGFICPSSSEMAIQNIAENVSSTGQSAFTWTGPYGSGKSSLALFLSALMGKDSKLRSMAQSIIKEKTKENFYNKISVTNGWDILPIVGDIKDPSDLIKEAIFKKTGKKSSDIFEDIKSLSDKSDGLLIFIDEMGKCLESAAKGIGDVYLFQQLAEFVSRSKGKIIFVGILHQSFAEYARYLPHTLRDEWQKIQGRFVDTPINTAGEEQIELISRAISYKHKPQSIINMVKKTVNTISKNKLITSKQELSEALIKCWPISPVVVSLLAQISKKRFGQNQRSIFSFLSSGEPKAFRDFINSTEFNDNNLYMPEDLFDYLKFNLESSILSSSDSKIWNTATDVLARSQAKGASLEHINILKTIALIDIFNGTSGLIANEDLLKAIYPNVNIKNILNDLSSWSVIIFKKHLNSYSIFEGSDFDIEAAIQEAYSSIPTLEIQKLADIANFKPIIAKRHYHKFGCMRWLDILLTPIDGYEEFLNKEHNQGKSVGFFSIFLPQSLNEVEKAKKIIQQHKQCSFPVFMTIAQNNQIINEYLKELLALEWIQKNKNELAGDRIARLEVENRRLVIISSLECQLNDILTSSIWYKDGKKIGIIKQNEFSVFASNVCDDVYSNTPEIKSELVNRTKPSGSANSALNILLKDMVLQDGEPLLGITGFTPERGLFNILLQETKIYVEDNNVWSFKTPTDKKLNILWEYTDELFKRANKAINLSEVYNHWSNPPFGIKAGLHNFLALAYMMSRRNQIAVYRDGSYIPEINDLLVDYLIKNHKSISLKLVEAEDYTSHILPAIAQLLNSLQEQNQIPLTSTPLIIARKLVNIIDRLPPWVLKTKTLSKNATKFREIVKSANDPHRLLFEDIEKVFGDDNEKEDKSAVIIRNMKETMEELLGIYPATMKNIALLLTNELDVPMATPTQLERLRERAKNIKGVSGNFRVDAFASRISTFSSTLNDIAGIISLANNKPPHDWIDLDIENAKKEILNLCTEFKKAELYTKVKNRPSSRQAVAFIAGIGGKAEVIQGEFDLLTDMQDEVLTLKKNIKTVLDSTTNRNILLEALTELSIEYLRAENE
ncbi:MAG: hypothetical protein V8R11_02380 [Alphaproteobacteria bacterium]